MRRPDFMKSQHGGAWGKRRLYNAPNLDGSSQRGKFFVLVPIRCRPLDGRRNVLCCRPGEIASLIACCIERHR